MYSILSQTLLLLLLPLLSTKMRETERELQDSIFKAAKAPQEKYKWPMTANQMIGWSWKDANEFREDDKKWLATHAQSEIVKYNENYVLAFGKSPFAR